MSKKSKSKNSIVKKAKKLQRQGKFEKAIQLCDDFLDNEKLEESVIRIKIDLLTDKFHANKLDEKFNQYTDELNYFLSEEEEIELLKFYTVFDKFYNQNEDFLSNPKALNTYLISGILIESVEPIIVMNGIIKEEPRGDNEDIPSDLREHVDELKKVTYQYLGLYFDNSKDYIANLNIDMEEIYEEIMSNVPIVKKETDGPVDPDDITDIMDEVENEIDSEDGEFSSEELKEIDSTIETEKPAETNEELKEPIKAKPDVEKVKSYFKLDSDRLNQEDIERIESEIESLKRQVAEANAENKFNKAYKLQERLIKASKSINPNGVEIRELKEEIKEANDVENYRKALKLQKKLLKLTKDNDIIDSESKEKSEQTTLFDDF